MEILKSIEDVRLYRSQNPIIHFVPTMGALHEGHQALMRQAKAYKNKLEVRNGPAHKVVVSIYVNPLQFGPNEDLSRYPRPLEKDLEILKSEGVDAVFLPSSDVITPPSITTSIVESSVSKPMCGEFRPGHFSGVMTIVLKLFNIVAPTRAYFGQKDYQQVAVIKRMCLDLNVPVEIETVPTVRESDGLALSSRNTYLSPEERLKATLLFKSLSAVRQAFLAGEHDRDRLEMLGRRMIEADQAFKLQYLDVRDGDSLESVSIVKTGSVVAIACYLGKTRLIDNLIL